MRGGGWVEWGSKRELGYKWGSGGSPDCIFFYFGSLDYSMFFQIRNGTLVCNVKGYQIVTLGILGVLWYL